MKFQEKFESYKQRQEAKRFFNQNNDYYLSVGDYVKLFAVGIIAATLTALVFDVISMQMNVNFLVFYLFTGYAVAFAVLKVAKYGSEKTGVICVISYLFGLWFSSSILIAYLYGSLGTSVSILICLKNGFYSLLNGNLISYLFIVVGAFIAYASGKD